MSQQKSNLTDIYNKLNAWLDDFKTSSKPQAIQLLREAKRYAGAAEDMSEEKLKQFVDNLKYDLHDFYQLNKTQADNSFYLGLLKETLWENLGQLTDKSQVEWAELVDDFEHNGRYHSGDFIGFGELKCQECLEHITILHFSEVTDCIHCGAKEFERLPLNP